MPTHADTLRLYAGVGHFTLLDPKITDAADVGVNFFLEQDSIGLPRAEQVVKFLVELNSDVNGTALVHSLDDLQDLSPYSLILAVDVEDPDQLVRLADLAWQHNVPLIKVESCGFYGTLRTQVKEITSTCPFSAPLSCRSMEITLDPPAPRAQSSKLTRNPSST